MSGQYRDMEEVYDSGTLQDEKCSLIDDGYWYENDLSLAADLGRTLLQRNRELEYQLTATHKANQEKQLEIDLLTKQLQTLRDLSQKKMRVYEEVDRHNQDLERANQTLQFEAAADKQKIHNLTRTTSTLEAQVEELTIRLREMELDREEWLRMRDKLQEREQQEREAYGFSESQLGGGRVRRVCSVPSVGPGQNDYWLNCRRHFFGTDASGGVFPCSCSRKEDMSVRVSMLATQLREERVRRTDLELDLEAAWSELEELRVALDTATEQTRRLQREQADYLSCASDLARLCSRCQEQIAHHDHLPEPELTKSPAAARPQTSRSSSHSHSTDTPTPSNHQSLTAEFDDSCNQLTFDLYSPVEPDRVIVDENRAQVGRLSGSAVFSSRESLNCMGASPDPIKVGVGGGGSGAGNTDPRHDISLLTELDQQYNKLVREYETLVQTKRASLEADCAVGAAGSGGEVISSDFQMKLDHIFSEETRRQRKTMITHDYKPKYKELFRDAFGLLKEIKQQQIPPNVPK